MRLDRFLPIAAAAFVVACNPQSADRSGAARAPIPAVQPSTAQPPAAQTAQADCPCPKETKSKAAAGPRRKAVVHKASHKTVAHPQRRTYRRYEALAGGPPPRSEYARVPPEYYENGPATSYRYGPAYPPAPAYRDDDYGRRESYRYERGDEGRYDDRRSGYEERGGRYEERRNGYEDRRAWREPAPPPPPPADRYGPERHQRWEDGRSHEGGAAFNERYSSREDYVRREPPPPAARHGYGERRAYEGRYEERSESSSTYGSRSESRGGPCCRSEAAGFDANGFLTWPGKVPARP